MAGDGKGITPANLIAATAVVIMALIAGGALMQSQLANVAKIHEDAQTATKEREAMLLERIKVLEVAARYQAHDPVEKATLDAIVAGIDKREELFQAQSTTQITDLNRQFAAALLTINANTQQSEVKKPAVMPPP